VSGCTAISDWKRSIPVAGFAVARSRWPGLGGDTIPRQNGRFQGSGPDSSVGTVLLIDVKVETCTRTFERARSQPRRKPGAKRASVRPDDPRPQSEASLVGHAIVGEQRPDDH
jgi:hypothetical protein